MEIVQKIWEDRRKLKTEVNKMKKIIQKIETTQVIQEVKQYHKKIEQASKFLEVRSTK